MILDTRYLLLRLGQAVLVLLLAFTAAFILLSLIPGDGVTARFADPALGLSPDQIAEIRNATGADESWFGSDASVSRSSSTFASTESSSASARSTPLRKTSRLTEE